MGIKKKYVLHILQPISKTEYGGADMHVLELSMAQKRAEDIEPIVLLRTNTKLQKRFESYGIACYCGERINNIFCFIKWAHINLAKYHFNIIHSHGYDANYQMALLKKIYKSRWRNIPTVITSHGWIETSLFLKLKTYLDFYCHRFANAHIVCSEKNLKRLNQIKNQKHYYVPNGISFIRFNSKKEKEKEKQIKRIAYIGRLSPEKRVDLFLKSAIKVINERTDVEYCIFGIGLELKKLKNIADKSGVMDKIKFEGLIDEIEDVYDNIDILILSSDTESTPRVILESLYNRIPVIATNVGDVSIMVRNGYNGYVVPRGDWEMIANRTIELLDAPQFRRILGVNGRKLVEKQFSIEIMTTKIQEIYLENM